MGMNVAGFLTAESGLGTAVRNAVCALKEAGIPYALSTVDCTDSRQDDTALRGEILNQAPYTISLLHVNPDYATKALHSLPSEFFSDKYRIGYWTWESDIVPGSWIRFASNFHEIWTPSTYVQTILAHALPIPVHCVPHPIVVDPIQAVTREELHLPHGFLFLCMFDYFSVFERKNPLGTIQAFRAAFEKSTPVHLVIKCINGHLFPREHQTLLDACHDDRITILDSYLSSEKTRGLISLCDALVSLHYSEGFGLSLAEAMALGTPVIATGFSGNTDFMNTENSFPIDFFLRKTKKRYGCYPKGSHWAEADIAHASAHMRAVFTQWESAASRSAQAANDMAEHYSPARVGALLAERIRNITAQAVRPM